MFPFKSIGTSIVSRHLRHVMRIMSRASRRVRHVTASCVSRHILFRNESNKLTSMITITKVIPPRDYVATYCDLKFSNGVKVLSISISLFKGVTYTDILFNNF